MTATTISIAQAANTQATTPNPTTTAYPEGATLRGVVDSAEPAFTPAAPLPVKEPYIIDSEQRANWLLRKIGNIRAERARIKAQTKAALDQLDADENSLLSQFGSQLEAWGRQAIADKGGKRKSIILLQGTVSVRTQPARTIVQDATTYALWAKDHEEETQGIVNTLYTLKPEALDYAKAHFQITGELLPGIAQTEEYEKFGFSFKSEAESAGEAA